MIVATSQDYALVAADCCPCLPPEAPAPRRECRSVTAGVVSVGHKDPDATAWGRSTIKTVTRSKSEAYSLTGFFSGYGAYTTQTVTSSASHATVETYGRLFSGSSGGVECPSWVATVTNSCTGSGSSTSTGYAVLAWGIDDGSEDYVNYEYVVSGITEKVVEDASGTQTAEHQDWEADAADWDAANPDHAAAVEAWEDDHDAWQAEYAQWEIDYDAWIVGGEVGPEPAVRDEPERPPDRQEEPLENHPPCTFKVTTTVTTKNWQFFPDGTTDHQPDTVEVYVDFYNDPTDAFTGALTTETTYGGTQGYTEWVAATKAAIQADLDFENAECLSDFCASTLAVTPEPAPPEAPESEGEEEPEPAPPFLNPSVSMTLTLVEHRIGIPDTEGYAGFGAAHAAWVIAHADWTALPLAERGVEPVEPVERSYYAWQGDEVFFPTAWEAWKSLKDAFDAATVAHEVWVAAGSDGEEPEIPDDPGTAPTTAPTLVATRSWTYDGTDEFSPWFEIAIPTIPGETRLVNQLARHYRSTRLGNKPTAFGEVYEF